MQKLHHKVVVVVDRREGSVGSVVRQVYHQTILSVSGTGVYDLSVPEPQVGSGLSGNSFQVTVLEFMVEKHVPVVGPGQLGRDRS